MSYIKAIDIVKKAFGKRKIMDCIEEIGFSNSIISHETIDTG
jgi:hypothetical protein